jgi:RNA-binding protein with serine-rich domain 1
MVRHLSRNVTKDHIEEIFSAYGKIKEVDLPVDRTHPYFSRGQAYVEFEKADEAEQAIDHFDGGQVV